MLCKVRKDSQTTLLLSSDLTHGRDGFLFTQTLPSHLSSFSVDVEGVQLQRRTDDTRRPDVSIGPPTGSVPKTKRLLAFE